MADQDGVEIYKRFYPWPTSFRLGDPVLVREVTGMRWPDFVAALDEMDEEEAPDQVVLAGLISVAFWQGNQQMSRDKARRAVERIPQDEVEIISGDEEGDVDPPAEAAGATPSATSSASAGSQEASDATEIPLASISDETSPNGSGSLGLLSVPPESLPV